VIDAGDNGALPGNLTQDLDVLERYTDVATKPDTGVGPPAVVDMGRAYEFHDLIFRNGFDVGRRPAFAERRAAVVFLLLAVFFAVTRDAVLRAR